MSEELCPLCNRPFGEKNVDQHHWIPSSRGGKEKSKLHKICHRKIHATFTEKQLEKHFHTVERIMENEDMKRFVIWVSKKDPDYYDHPDRTKRMKRR